MLSATDYSTARILRYAMVNFIFREEPAGHVRHAMIPAQLAQAPNFCDSLRTLASLGLQPGQCLVCSLRYGGGLTLSP